jgi:hypothetical protein
VKPNGVKVGHPLFAQAPVYLVAASLFGHRQVSGSDFARIATPKNGLRMTQNGEPRTVRVVALKSATM